MYNNLCVAIIRLVLSVFYMLLRIASLSLNVKFQFRRVVNVSLFSNSSIFFSGDGSSLRSPAIPLYIIHITFGMLRVMKMKEVKKKSNNVLIIYLVVSFKSTSEQHFFLECWPIWLDTVSLKKSWYTCFNAK